MGWRASHWAVSQKAGSAAAKAVLLVLAEASKDSSCTLSHATIAERAEVDRRTVIRQMKNLEARGLIRRRRRVDGNGHRTSDLTTLAIAQGDPLSLGQGDASSPRPRGTASPRGATLGDSEGAAKATSTTRLGGMVAQEPGAEPVFEPGIDTPAAQAALVLIAPEGSADPVSEAHAAWNELASRCGLAQARDFTKRREDGLRRTLRRLGPGGWTRVLEIVEATPFTQGENKNGWRVTLDWLLSPENLTKLLDGNYAPQRSRPEERRISPLEWAKRGL